jgi:hypothetical protein
MLTSFAIPFQEVQCHPLCRFRPDTGQAPEGIYQAFKKWL